MGSGFRSCSGGHPGRDLGTSLPIRRLGLIDRASCLVTLPPNF